MAKKGKTHQQYTVEFKENAVALYEQKGVSYEAIAKELGVPSATQIKDWVRKKRIGESLENQRGKTTKSENFFKGCPRSKFTSVEEERDYLKAQVEYLKKRYPNL